MKHDGMTEKKSEVKAALATCRSAFFMTAAFSAFINLLMLVSPLYMMQVYDRVLHSRSEATLLMLTLITVALLGVMALLEVIRSRILVRVGDRLDQQLSERILSAQFQASLHRIESNPGQASRDFDTVRQFLSDRSRHFRLLRRPLDTADPGAHVHVPPGAGLDRAVWRHRPVHLGAGQRSGDQEAAGSRKPQRRGGIRRHRQQHAQCRSA